ncbi:MAG: hypothetical protein M3O23_10505 [Actinomycetota bacterium]|nr:hypothetical protein [Actinomycetota bacterium]
MGAQRTTFSKLQRDRAKKAKAALKRERRQERGAATTTADPELDVTSGEGELSASELLKLVESIHRSFEAKQITYEEYEEKKADLLSRLPVD